MEENNELEIDSEDTIHEEETILKIPQEYSFICKEKYGRYQRIWLDLLSDRLESTYRLEFEKKFDPASASSELFTKGYPRTEENIIKELKKCKWRTGEFDKQHWGLWLHSLSPYQGRLKPAFTHWLIKIFTSDNDTIWDPFCGIGTVPLEASLLGRSAIGTDLNPYAVLIATGKSNPRTLKENLEYLKSLKDIDISNVTLDHVPEWIKAYYHQDTLKEILSVNRRLYEDKRDFLYGCLMGILHGNRPGYLSVYTGCIIPMKPRSKDHPKFRLDKDTPEYRAVIPRLAAKVMRMFQNYIPPTKQMKIFKADARYAPLDDHSIDCIISSPPYYNTLDYVDTNKVRLYFLSLNIHVDSGLSEELIQDKKKYLEEMKKVGLEMKRILKKGKYLVFVLGDVHYTTYSINTAEEVSNIYKDLGFEPIAIVNDEIPGNKTASQTRRQKFDRILVMKNKG